MVIIGTWIRIHSNTKSDQLMEPTQKKHPTIDCSALYTYDSTSLENHLAKEPPPTTQNYMSGQNGRHPTGQSPHRP